MGAAGLTLCFGVSLKGVEIKDTARVHQTSDRGEETHVLLLLQMVQHAHLDVDVAASQDGDAEIECRHYHLRRYTFGGGNVQQHHFGNATIGETCLMEEQFLLFHLLFLLGISKVINRVG